ncbi:MAG: hypothetical protein KC897_01770 [Candidatus Omnitrophica bacterium]|nr:hypothetical protein [Candidatus Omnitrophota bacterium]MCB9721952.1 hypothetical protein [Candidatus Omnitrophota bacterium]
MKPISSLMAIALYLFVSAGPSQAEYELSPRQLQRFDRVRHILQPLDDKNREEARFELIGMKPVEGHLRLQEIMAGTYQDLVGEFQINTALGRRQLYGRIQMNMAFLQMGGLKLNELPPPGLDRDIAVRLKERISEELAADERLFYTLGD